MTLLAYDNAPQLNCSFQPVFFLTPALTLIFLVKSVTRSPPAKESDINEYMVGSFWKIQDERLENGDIKPNTHKQKAKPVALLRKSVGMKLISSVNVRDVAQILESYVAEGQPRMAQVIRSVLNDVFKEAQHYDVVPPDYNPALATKQPRRRISRQRLHLEKWQKIFAIADARHHYMSNAMLLALVTGQRLGDSSNMKFSDIWDDHLHVVQEKTGTKLAIPLSLKLNAIDWSL